MLKRKCINGRKTTFTKEITFTLEILKFIVLQLSFGRCTVRGTVNNLFDWQLYYFGFKMCD